MRAPQDEVFPLVVRSASSRVSNHEADDVPTLHKVPGAML
jgi:hypothetical protein